MHRAILFVCLAILPLLASGEGDARPSTEPMKEKFRAVIQGQLDAFRKDDYAGAYRFAAKGIQEQFPVSAFEKMVRESYPVIAKNEEAVFGLSVDDGQKAIVNVRVLGQNKASTSYQYILERDDGDDWRILGVLVLRESDPPI
jgi:hypothetical protein